MELFDMRIHYVGGTTSERHNIDWLTALEQLHGLYVIGTSSNVTSVVLVMAGMLADIDKLANAITPVVNILDDSRTARNARMQADAKG